MKQINCMKQSALLNFKRWLGEDYAIFTTINKQIRIGFLLTVYLTCMGFHTTFGQTDTLTIQKKIKLDEVRISGRRAPSLYCGNRPYGHCFVEGPNRSGPGSECPGTFTPCDGCGCA
jgi:hypothetical protein